MGKIVTRHVAFSIDEDLYEQLRETAKEDRRSIGNYIAAMIESALKRNQIGTKQASK